MQCPSANSAVWGLNVRSKCSQHPFKPNLDQKQSAGNRKGFALFNSLNAERRKEGRKVAKSGVSERAEVTGLQGVREEAGS